MICGDQGRIANAENLLSQSARFLLSDDDAKAIIGDMRDHIRNTWYEVARSASVSEKDCERIAGAFAYPGFDLERAHPTDSD
jgi:serine/threonine-protein kinase HipA